MMQGMDEKNMVLSHYTKSMSSLINDTLHSLFIMTKTGK